MSYEFKWRKELTLELITCYEMHPVLYDTSNPDYNNKIKRTKAFDSILEHLRVYDSDISLELIKRKIHTLRTQFIKEFREFDKSKKSGACLDDTHEPKLWCFQELEFLRPHCKSRSSVSIIIEDYNNESFDSSNTGQLFESSMSSKETSKNKMAHEELNRSKESPQTTESIQAKAVQESEYAWLGKQVVCQLEKIQSEQIRMNASWAIQSILHASVQEDFNLRQWQRITSIPSTSSGHSSKVPLVVDECVVKEEVDEGRPLSSQPNMTTHSFTPGLLEKSMQEVFKEEDFA